MRTHRGVSCKVTRPMHSAGVLPAIRRFVMVLGLVAAASVTGVRPMPLGAAAATLGHSQAMHVSSAARATTAASFEIKVTPESGVGQSDIVLITGNTPVDAANRPIKIRVTLPDGTHTAEGFAPVRQTDGYFAVCFNLT